MDSIENRGVKLHTIKILMYDILQDGIVYIDKTGGNRRGVFRYKHVTNNFFFKTDHFFIFSFFLTCSSPTCIRYYVII